MADKSKIEWTDATLACNVSYGIENWDHEACRLPLRHIARKLSRQSFGGREVVHTLQGVAQSRGIWRRRYTIRRLGCSVQCRQERRSEGGIQTKAAPKGGQSEVCFCSSRGQTAGQSTGKLPRADGRNSKSQRAAMRGLRTYRAGCAS